MWRGSASGARINDLHAYLCAFRSKPPVSANRVTQTRSSPLLPSPLPRKRIPEKRFENFQSSEPSGAEPGRAVRSRHVGYIFFFLFFFLFSSLSPSPIYSPPTLSRAAHPSLSTAHTRIYSEIGIYTRACDRPIDWRSLFFPEREEKREGISAKAGSNG